jgi:hypothetical protein
VPARPAIAVTGLEDHRWNSPPPRRTPAAHPVRGHRRRRSPQRAARQQAWRTIHHAADQARPGDTILIGEGVYREHVRVRTTGERGAPITFRAHPGERVVLDGQHKQLQNAFTIFNKHHIHVDGLYVKDHARGPMRTGSFGLLRARHIRLTRIFHDGRGRAPTLPC